MAMDLDDYTKGLEAKSYKAQEQLAQALEALQIANDRIKELLVENSRLRKQVSTAVDKHVHWDPNMVH